MVRPERTGSMTQIVKDRLGAFRRTLQIYTQFAEMHDRRCDPRDGPGSGCLYVAALCTEITPYIYPSKTPMQMVCGLVSVSVGAPLDSESEGVPRETMLRLVEKTCS